MGFPNPSQKTILTPGITQTMVPRTQNLPRLKPYHNSDPSTLPLPKHHLPARPPAEVCVHQPCTPFNTDSEDPKHGPAPPQDLAPHTSNPDLIPRGDLQDDTSIPIEPPAFRGDFAEESPSSPSASSSDDSLEGFFRLPDAQDDIPIDPVILANHEPWADSSLQEFAQQADSLINSETTYPYPDPPPVLHNPPDLYRDSSEGAGRQNSDTQTSDSPRINNHQQVNPSEHDTHPDASYSILQVGNHMSVDNPKALSGRCKKQTDNFANGVDFPLRYCQGRIPLLCSVLTSCLYHSTNVCNSSRGCLKALYHVACPTPRQQRMKIDLRGKRAARILPTRSNKIGLKEARGRACHGPRKRWTFC